MSTQLQYSYCSPHQQIARTPPGLSRLELLDSGGTRVSLVLHQLSDSKSYDFDPLQMHEHRDFRLLACPQLPLAH